MDDETLGLARDASHGDGRAVERLLCAELPALRAYVRLRAGAAVRAHESCSDLVQSVCRELLVDLPKLEFESAGAFRRWLFQAAERKVVDRARHWRAEKRDAAREQPLGENGDHELALTRSYAQILSPSAGASLREEQARLEAAFDRLPPHYREVITLARIVGLSHAEIARALDKREGAVRTLLYRALAELSEELRR